MQEKPKLPKKPEEPKMQKGLEEAISQRDKLLEFDKNR